MKRRGQDWRTSSMVVAVSGKHEPPHYSLPPSDTSQSSFRFFSSSWIGPRISPPGLVAE